MSALVVVCGLGLALVGFALALAWAAIKKGTGRPVGRRVWKVLLVVGVVGAALFIALELANAGIW